MSVSFSKKFILNYWNDFYRCGQFAKILTKLGHKNVFPLTPVAVGNCPLYLYYQNLHNNFLAAIRGWCEAQSLPVSPASLEAVCREAVVSEMETRLVTLHL